MTKTKQRGFTRELRSGELERVRGGGEIVGTSSLSGGTTTESRDQGIKVFIDVVYNHTAE
jgi:hypothetical protein